MRLVRFLRDGRAVLGAVGEGGIVPLDGLGFGGMSEVIVGGDAALGRIRDHLADATPEIAVAGAPLLAPLERPGKYLAIGMNYRDHAKEAQKLGIDVPDHQLWFNKQTTCISGPFDDIDPGVTEKLDYEVELGVVIGRRAKHVAEANARPYVFGYLVANDVSARDWQFHSQTFTMGKSFDTHGPIGPWIVTADEIDDPHDLAIRCFVNGELRQDSNTSRLIHNIWAQIAYLSTAFTLEPGDLIATGTPEGVGIALDPPLFLSEGDVVRCEIDGIGAIVNKVARPAPVAAGGRAA
ncbi:fumarylacetoacetate hydrolase family protein [uncultured Sphingomonas sp.]|uniref:fumarylacetoacetate hydrolase family protein n=1 Tax=uncultured Sphingomonas sp. TaxID=158754 RepID=UPI0035CBDB33